MDPKKFLFVDIRNKIHNKIIDNYTGCETQLISLKKFDFVHKKADKMYILCEIIEIDQPVRGTDAEESVQILLREFVLNEKDEVKDFGLVFRAVFNKKCVKYVDETIRIGWMKVGATILIVKPVIKIDTNQLADLLVFSKSYDHRVTVELSDESDVYVFCCYRNAYIFMCPGSKYNHLSIYNLSLEGNRNHAVSNLISLAKGKGTLATVEEIPTEYPGSRFVIAEIERIISTKTAVFCEAEVCISFNEVTISPNSTNTQSFVVHYFGELAKEIQDALVNNYITSKDLVLFCDPKFEKFTGAPIKMRFGSSGKNLIILHSKHAKEGEVVSDNDLNITEKIYLDLMISKREISFVYVRSLSKMEDTLKQASLKLENYGTLTTLRTLYEGKESTKNNQLVLSYFFKLVKLSTSLDDKKYAVLFVREILFPSQKGMFFKANLCKDVAEQFCSLLQSGKVVKGDIIVFVNPIVRQNPGYLHATLLDDEPFCLDVSLTQQTPVIICKLSKNISKEQLCFKRKALEQNNSEKEPKFEIKNEIEVPLKVSMDQLPKSEELVLISDAPAVVSDNNPKNISKKQVCFKRKALEQNNSEEEPKFKIKNEIEVPLTVSMDQLPKSKEVVLISDAPVVVSDNNPKPKVQMDYKEFLIAPFHVSKPCLRNGLMNLVSGFCAKSCFSLIPFNDINWSLTKKPFCPRCKCLLDTQFKFEMEGLILPEGRIIEMLLAKEKAEIFLGVTCKDFVESEDAQKTALESLKKKTLKGELRYQKRVTLKVKDVTGFKYKI